MDKRTLMIPVLAGMMFGQLFAEGDGPIQISNTVRVGYDDNLYKNDKNNKTETAFISDIIDLSGRVSFSDRTALLTKARLTVRNDTEGTIVSPELSAVLSHTVSPRLLMRLSENYRSGDSSGTIPNVGGNVRKRYTYDNNRIGVSGDYVLSGKDRLEGSLDYDIMRNEDDIERKLNSDTTTVEAGTSWKHDIIQQRTYSTFNVRQRWVDYDHRSDSFEATDISGGLNHTFNPKLQGSVEGGFTQIRPDYQAPASNDSSISPLVRVGLSYSPSPRTRISGDFGHSYSTSSDQTYGGQTTTDMRFGFQHEITAKLSAKATARFAKSDYSSDDAKKGSSSNTEDRMDLAFRLTYKLNRMHFIDMGVTHSEVASENYTDWKQNVIDVGWRVDFN